MGQTCRPWTHPRVEKWVQLRSESAKPGEADSSGLLVLDSQMVTTIVHPNKVKAAWAPGWTRIRNMTRWFNLCSSLFWRFHFLISGLWNPFFFETVGLMLILEQQLVWLDQVWIIIFPSFVLPVFSHHFLRFGKASRSHLACGRPIEVGPWVPATLGGHGQIGKSSTGSPWELCMLYIYIYLYAWWWLLLSLLLHYSHSDIL